VTDETGEVVGSARYDAFGRLLENSIPPMVTLRLYSGSIYDPDTGLYKIGARWYDPVIGLWLTPDSLVPDVNNPIAWNGYAFNYNNPVNYVDPSGHFALPAGLLLIAAAGFLGGEIYAVSQGYNALDLEFWQYSFEGAFLAISAYFSVADVALMAGYGLQGAGMWVGPRFFGPRLFGWGMRTAGLGVAMYAWAFQPLRFRPYWKVEWVGGGGGGGLGYDDETPGSLPPEWTRQIQEVVDETGVPINVVGGYARGDPHPRKDIDYYVEIPLRDLWTQEMRAKLPGPSHFVHNDVLAYELGWTSRPPGLYRPYIQFSPGQPPVWVRAPWMN
jgi:RHS repeat-associated protein